MNLILWTCFTLSMGEIFDQVIFSRERDAIVHFYGDSTVFYGAFPDGFIKLVENYLLQFVQGRHLALVPFSDPTSNSEMVKNMILSKRFDPDVMDVGGHGDMGYTPKPDVVLVMMGDDDILSSRENREMDIEEFEESFKDHVHQILSHFRNFDVPNIYISSPTLSTERIHRDDQFEPTDIEKEDEEYYEMISSVIEQAAKDYGVHFIDTRSAILKYLEHFNVENLSGSLLTHDGHRLNNLGNKLVASVILSSLGAAKTTFMDLDYLVNEPERHKLNPIFFAHELFGEDLSGESFEFHHNNIVGMEEFDVETEYADPNYFQSDEL